MFQDYDIVKLAKDLPNENLKLGAEGTIVMIYPKQSEWDKYEGKTNSANNDFEERFYEVEFFDNDGNTSAVLTLRESLLQRVSSDCEETLAVS